jgi:preprotein translocase subunit YajC
MFTLDTGREIKRGSEVCTMMGLVCLVLSIDADDGTAEIVWCNPHAEITDRYFSCYPLGLLS